MNAQKFYAAFQSRSFLPQIITLLALLVIACGVISSTAQSPEKEERKIETRIPAHLPIKVKFKYDEKLKDLKNEDWLGDLEVEVTNTGDEADLLSLHTAIAAGCGDGRPSGDKNRGIHPGIRQS
jgi:hypothetical protein